MTFVKKIAGRVALGAVLLLGPIASPTQAEYVVTLEEVGNDVVATGSRLIDLTGLNGPDTNPVGTGVQPELGVIITGPTGLTPVDIYTGFTGPLLRSIRMFSILSLT